MKPELIILDVGHGNCAVLLDTGGTVVIDAGPRGFLLQFLKSENIFRVDVVLLSHSDADHIGGLVELISSDEFDIGLVRMNSDATKQNSEEFRDLLYAMKHAQKMGKVKSELSLNSGNDKEFNQGLVDIEILFPDIVIAGLSAGNLDKFNRRITTNYASAVVRLSMEGRNLVLLPGDLTFNGLKYMIEDKIDYNAELVIFPHHGGLPEGDMMRFAEEFLSKISPKTIVFSIGRNLTTPRPELLAYIKKHLPETRIVCTELSKHCAANAPTVISSHLSGKYASGRKRNICCGGTIVVDLTSVNPIVPLLENHQTFVNINAETALCRRS